MNLKTLFPLVLIVLVAAGTMLVGQERERQPRRLQRAQPRQAVVHLSHFTDDLHRGFMALKVANMMQKGGVPTTLFLDIEGARVADKDQSLEVRWGPSETTMAELYAAFVEADGKVVVCPHCAHAAGLDKESLREGAMIATEEQLGQILMRADKIMDY